MPTPARKPAPKKASKDIWLHGAIRVVHEDADLIVVDKPSGLLSVAPPEIESQNVFDEVKSHVREAARRRGTRVWVIHRLDKEASGLLVFAKTERAFLWLKEQFRAKRVHRQYAAVVEGEIPPAAPPTPGADGLTPLPEPPSGTIQSFLYEDDRGLVHSAPTPGAVPRGARAVDDEDVSGPKLAVTHWRAQQTGMGRSMLQVRLETGRKHQIRAHLAGMRYPIVGDRRYGAKTDPLNRVCLHAFELGFTHPTSGANLRFRSPTPGSFFGLVGKKDEPQPAPKPAAKPPATPTAPAPAPEQRAAEPDAAQSSWDHVAEWYDKLIDDRGSDHHEHVIIPGTLRLLDAQRGHRVLDVACGQGILARRLGALGVRVVGVDAAPRLIDAAKRANQPGTPAEYLVGDARDLSKVTAGPFDRAACVMALMNIDPLTPVLRGIADLLAPRGLFVAITLHPAFRAPGQTSWGWETPNDKPPSPKDKGRRKSHAAEPVVRQYRRVDGYLSPGQREIVMNPGAAARGKPAVTTVTYHRPIQQYVRAFAEAGLLIDAIEEWPSLRTSQPGPRAAEENRARREIPMFMAVRAVKA